MRQRKTVGMETNGVNHDIVRTLSIVRELAQGKRLNLEVGTVAMGQDMSIGFIHTKEGEDFVSGLSTMDLCELNKLLNTHNIGMAIPDS